MEFDKGNMIVNEVDLDFLLKRYIYQYRFRNDNKLPKKIIIKSSRDCVELTEAAWAEVQGKKVKYEFGGFGDIKPDKVDVLGKTLYNVLLSIGVVNADIAMPSYPEILLAADEFINSKREEVSDTSGHKRTRRSGKSTTTKRGSKSGTTEPTESK